MNDKPDALSIVSTCDGVLGQVNGITVVFVSVERRTTCRVPNPICLVLNVRCPPNEVTLGMDARYRADFEAWVPERTAARDRGERGPDPPEYPDAFLNDLPLALADDVGTVYGAPWRKSAGGSGTEWQGMWFFETVPPPEARSLTVSLDVPGGRPHTMPL
jgi:hypothetical protein